MPISSSFNDFPPLVSDNEIVVGNLDHLAELIAEVMLGRYIHVQKILEAKTSTAISPDRIIDATINRLNNMDQDHRDGWIFQIISWIALHKDHIGQRYLAQQPHDAPAQHGLDGLAIVLDESDKIVKIIITEDKCTTNIRSTIKQKVWPEFLDFEEGSQDNKLVSRISALISQVDGGRILDENMNDIFNFDLRRYRVGINRTPKYNTAKKRKSLFKGYDGCVKGADNTRRTAATFFQTDIRAWMADMKIRIIEYLESKKTKDV